MRAPIELPPKLAGDTPRFDHKVIRPNGRWVPAQQTDVSKTWARAREKEAGRIANAGIIAAAARG